MLKETPFTATHIALGAKMAEFAGFNMPIQYPTGIQEEHRIVREGVGVFDVSHMGEFWVKGAQAADFLQYITTNDINKLDAGKAQYTCFPNGKGGIVDDLIVYKYSTTKYLLVVNAGNIDKDWAWVNLQLDNLRLNDCKLENASDRYGQLAVQGPKATEMLQKLTDADLSAIPYYSFREEHIFEGDTVEFFGEKYFTSDTYYHHSETDEGCDSTSVLQLIVHPLVDTIVTVCEPELPYLWVNKWNGAVTPLYNAGLYRNDTTYVNGKRMFYGLLLNVSKPVYDTTRVAICKGSSHTFKGVAITEAGIYRDTLRAHNGCDSIETLILTVNEPYFGTRTEHIFEGDTVEFFGEKYFTTGTYYYHSETNEGCDSTSVLQLIVHPLVDTVVTVCKSDLPYLWVNKWNSSVTPLYNAGIYRNDTTYVGGERMFYGLQLIVNEPTDTTIYRKICEGDLYNFNNRLLGTSGEYRDTIKNVNGCDSVVMYSRNTITRSSVRFTKATP